VWWLVAALCVLLAACRTVEPAPDAGAHGANDLLATAPLDGVPVFAGVSPRLQNREDEAAVARAHAALQASRFISLAGEAVFYAERTVYGVDYIQSVSIKDDFALADELSDSLTPVGSYQDERGSFALFVLEGHRIGPFGFTPRDASGRPVWLERHPRIDGFYVGVGTAGRSRLESNSIENADREALFGVLAELSVDVASGSTEWTVAGRGTVSGGTNMQMASGVLVGFYVLDRWIGDDGTHYALAICPKAQPRQ
jgi:hypothetical protein